MTTFNIEDFLTRTHEGNFSTKRPRVPGGEYPGQLADGKAGLDVKIAKTKNGERFILTLGWEILDDHVRAVTGLDKPRVTQDVWLDLNSNGDLLRDKTSNIDLGRLLAGLNLNLGTFSFSQLRSVGLCKVKVVEDPDKEKKEPDGSPVIYNRVVAVVLFQGAS